MKLKQIAAAALLAAGATAASAAMTSEYSYIDSGAFVYTFAATAIMPNENLFAFSLDLNDTDFLTFFTSDMDYFVTGGISGTKYTISSVKLNDVAWVPTIGSDIDLGTLTVGPDSTLVVMVEGARTDRGANFNGQLVLTPVPEPETYALMLAGLAAVGFVAARRRNQG